MHLPPPTSLDRLNFLVTKRYSLSPAFSISLRACSWFVWREKCVLVRNANGAKSRGLLETVEGLSLDMTDSLYRVINQRLFQVAPTNAYRSLCVTLSRVRFVEVSINQWHHRGPSSGSLSFGSGIGRRAARIVFVLFLDESVVAFCFFCYLSGRTCALSKVRRRLRWSLVTMTTRAPLRVFGGASRNRPYTLDLNDCRQRRERALVRGRAAVDDTVHASRDRSWTAQGSHQRRSHLRVPW